MDEKDLGRLAIQAAGVAKKGIGLKAGAIVGVLFLLGLILMGAVLPAPTAAASSCEDTGAGTGPAAPVSDTSTSAPATGSVHDQQIANAKAIDQVAVKLGLPGKATLIALMAAMQESSLQNIDYGDRDSIGLFQQRPSSGWGTKDQIMDVSFATTSFFQGRGTNEGLVDIPNWLTRPPGVDAQQVEKSAYPDLYAGHESEVRALAQEAGIDLGRAGTVKGTTDSDTSATSGAVPSQCPNHNPKAPSGNGETFSDGNQQWVITNPRTVTQAIAWARAHAGENSTSGWYQRCLAFTAIVYGWNYSGVDTALDQYQTVPASMRHPGDRNPPPGALLYWDTGHPAGHIAVYLGNDEVASNDITRVGYIDIVKAEEFETKWGAKYLGWTPPYFPKGG